MPLDAIILPTAIVAVFGFFAAVLVFGDATWSRPAKTIRNPESDRSRH